MDPSHSCECCWAELLRSHRPAIRLFTCLRAWRYVSLQHKHRFRMPLPREWQQARFFEMELPLHAAVTALNHNEDALDEAFELLGSIYALYPKSAELFDHQRRSSLYYALEQRWGLEKLSWLVDKSLDVVLEKDSDGLSIVTHANTNNCPEELVIRLAVAAASRCIFSVDELLNGQYFENARRFCHRTLQDFFAGVPKFPHVQCREVLNVQRQYGEGQAYLASTSIKEIWERFIDTWGHFGAPLLQRDLPEELFPVIDSFVEIALVAKGEPLTYQWFIQQEGHVEGTPIDGATQSFIFLSPSIQPHNEGIYYCEVANRRGCVSSTRMVVRVIDDRMPPDPTLNFIVDRALLTPGGHTLRCLKASAGGRIHDLQANAAIVFQPDFFKCLDRDGNDISETHGAEIAISRRVGDEMRLKLHPGECLVSCLFDILPQSMGDLLRPALLWLPHCSVESARNTAVVVEVDTKSGRVLRDVDHAFIGDGFARVATNRLGTFAVISRQKNLQASSESIVERARLFLMRPKRLSGSPNSDKIVIFLALVRDLSNHCSEAEVRLKEMKDPAFEWTIHSFQLSIRENFSLNLKISGGARVVYRWPSPSPEVVATQLEISFVNLMTESSGIDVDQSAFLNISFHGTVCKTPIQTRTHVTSVETKSPDAAESTLFKRDWTVMIPFLHDDKVVFEVPPPTPSIVERTSTRIVLALNVYSPQEDKHDNVDRSRAGDSEKVLNGMTDEQRAFSPYFYVVEMAVFSPTFWRRYDQTWWFNKTKTHVIEGMYEVVHRGFDTKVIISTSAYAGCVRVARCSIDHFGGYSEPLLLTPLMDVEPQLPSDQLFRIEPALPDNHSAEMVETNGRLQQLLSDLHIGSTTLATVYGLPRSVKNSTDVAAALVKAKSSFGACNLEVALLLSGFKALEQQISRIKVASGSYAEFMERFLRIKYAIPDLDYCPVGLLPITQRLHELLREAFDVIIKLTNPGWLQYFLLDEWFEDALHKIFLNTAELLASDGCRLQCAKVLQASLAAPLGDSIPWSIQSARAYLLIAVGRLQEASDRATKLFICRELCHTLQLYPDKISQQEGDDDEDLVSLTATNLLLEFESSTSQQALTTLRQQDSFSKHLVCVTPRDGEKCASVPEAVHFDLDPFIRGVNRTGMHLVIRVSNVSLDSCTVQGKATFCERTARLSFFPAAEFERKTRYRATVREQEILSSLGNTLPERPPFTIHFTTPA